MKAFLLSAGLGTRLRPITDNIPKCLVEINSKPLLYHWLDLLEKENIDEVLINTHYLPEKIEDAVAKRVNKIKIFLSHEKKLLGSGGTLLRNKNFVENDENFFLLYSDNLSNISLDYIYSLHKKKNAVISLYAYLTNVPKQKGIFEVEENSGAVLSFEEKPEYPKSNIANSGLGVLNNKIFDYFPDKEFIDFSKEIIPIVTKDLNVVLSEYYIKDIGSMQDYIQAQEEWMKINNKQA